MNQSQMTLEIKQGKILQKQQKIKYIKQNAPKTEEAIARLDEIAKRENLPEDIVKDFREQIKNKFSK